METIGSRGRAMEVQFFATAAEFRAWLEAHHSTVATALFEAWEWAAVMHASTVGRLSPLAARGPSVRCGSAEGPKGRRPRSTIGWRRGEGRIRDTEENEEKHHMQVRRSRVTGGGESALRRLRGNMRGFAGRTAVVSLSLLSGCSNPGAPTILSDAFIEVGRVELEESDLDPIVRIDHIGRLPDGGFILTDRHAGRVRLFDVEGRETRALGQPGDGPGELNEPVAATLLSDGRVAVVQRGDPRLTVFKDDSVSVRRVPGAYGYWISAAAGHVVAGVATPEERFAVLDLDGETHRRFGRRDPVVAETPFWIFFAREHAAVLGDEIAINTSFFPSIRIHDVDGDSLRSFGSPPPGWIEPTTPPVEDTRGVGDRRRIEEWARSFTVVSALAAAGADHLVVQYGRHEPNEVDPYEVSPRSIDVYEVSGRKVAEGLELRHPVVGGGEELLVLTGEPPRPWTITRYVLKEPER